MASAVKRGLAAALSAGLLAAAGAPALARLAAGPTDAVTRFASVGAPGHADSSLLLPNGDLLVSTNRGATAPLSPGGPSRLFRYDATGRLAATITVRGQDLAGEHGLMSMALDGEGRVYVADYSPPRVLRIDPETGAQETYATVPDLVGAADNAAGGDSEPWPDGVAFLPDGTLLVTDLAQGTVFAVARGGGPARVWLQGPELSSRFGPNNLVATPDGAVLLDTTASLAAPTAQSGRGALYRIPLRADRSAGSPELLYATRPGEGPDGYALGSSGRIYLATLVTDTIIVLAPGGRTEERRITTPPGGSASLDSPSSATLVGDQLLVTNLTYFTGSTANDAVLRIDVGDTGVPAFRPPVDPSAAPPAPGSGATTPIRPSTAPPSTAPPSTAPPSTAPPRSAPSRPARAPAGAAPTRRNAASRPAQPARTLAFTGAPPALPALLLLGSAAVALLLRHRTRPTARARRPTVQA